MTQAVFMLRMSETILVASALSVAAPVESIIIPASIPMIIMTMSISTRVKPRDLPRAASVCFMDDSSVSL